MEGVLAWKGYWHGRVGGALIFGNRICIWLVWTFIKAHHFLSPLSFFLYLFLSFLFKLLGTVLQRRIT